MNAALRIVGSLVLLLLVSSCSSGDSDTEVCDNGFDDDGDALVDCSDDECAGPACAELCVDGWDNDGDDAIDCLDTDCDGGCPESCADNRDNDGDGLLDCADDECIDAVAETCDDGIDNDCDAQVDCADPHCDGGCVEECADTRDNDGDGLSDCEDDECDGYLGCPERCFDERDNDLDGEIDCEDDACDVPCDADGDGHESEDGGGLDCDDGNDKIHPLAPEICNEGVDDDCNGVADDQDPGVEKQSTQPYYNDTDGDGFGSAAEGIACVAPAGKSSLGGDCNDFEPDQNPGEPEVCNDRDDDCDSRVDDQDADLDLTTGMPFYEDVDRDGFGDPDVMVLACEAPPGFVANADDCHLFDADIGLETEWWPDGDGDGYGVVGLTVFECVAPVGYADNTSDCDDADPDVFPGVVGVWPSLLGAWQADGSTADSAGLQAEGVLVDDATFLDAGQYGQCFAVDGAGDRVEIPFSHQGPFTVSLWVAPAVPPQEGDGVLSSSAVDTADDTFELRTHAPDLIEVHSNLATATAGVATVGAWVHVAFAFDGTDILTWSNGVVVAVEPWVAATDPAFDALVIGTDRTGTLDFGGLVDDLLVFDRALTDAEVSALTDGSASCLAL